MTNENWTKGKWLVTDTCSDYKFCVVRVGNIDINVDRETNAHLIAAAPELYDALKEAVEYIGEIADCEEDVQTHERWLTILAKARGECLQAQ